MCLIQRNCQNQVVIMLVTIPYVSSMSAHLPLLRLRRLEARLPRLQPEKIGTTRPPKEFTIPRQEARPLPHPQRPAPHTSTTRRPLVAPPPPTSQTFPSRLASSRKNRPLQQWLRRSRHLHLRSIHPQHQFTGRHVKVSYFLANLFDYFNGYSLSSSLKNGFLDFGQFNQSIGLKLKRL